MMEGFSKEDPPTKKNLPVGIDVPEFLAQLGIEKDATGILKAVDDCAVIEFYNFLQVGEYTVGGNKQYKTMVQFKLEDTMVFCQDDQENLRQLPINELDEEIFLQMEKL